MEALIPCHAKDKEILGAAIGGLQKYAPEVSDIYVVSKERLTVSAYWIPEGDMPFGMSDVEERLPGHDGCARWYLQQLVKWNASSFLPGLRWLQWDADVVLQRPVRFIGGDGKALLSRYCDPHFHQAYFDHLARLVPGVGPSGPQSLIAHHLVYDRQVLDSLLREIETVHGRPWWEAFLACIDPAWLTRSGAAENEEYSAYALARFPGRYRVRDLRFRELKKGQTDPSLDFASYQSWNT